MALSLSFFKLCFAYYSLLLAKWIQANVVDTLLQAFLGFTTMYGNVKECHHQDYEKSAHLVNVWARASYFHFAVQHLRNFFYTHSAYLNPDWVLHKPNVTLQGVTYTHVFFCVTDPSVDVTDLSKFPFVTDAQWFNAKQLVVMPHWAFHRLAVQIGAPEENGKEVVFITNSARSGSTLLCQIFAKLPDTMVMSEPWALAHAHACYGNGEINQTTYCQLLKDIFTVLCHTNHSRFVIKGTLLCSPQVELVKKISPRIKQVFSTRHPRPSVVSFYRLLSHPMHDLLTSRWYWDDFWTGRMPLPYNQDKYKDVKEDFLNPKFIKKVIEASSCAYASCLACCLDNKHSYARIVVYEDIVGDPAKETSRLFQSLGIPNGLVKNTLSAFQSHSQKHFFGKTDGRATEYVTQQQWRKVDEVFNMVHLPFGTDVDQETFSNLLNK